MGVMKKVYNCQGFQSTENTFFSGLDRASEIVEEWPSWKKSVLGSSISTSKKDSEYRKTDKK